MRAVVFRLIENIRSFLSKNAKDFYAYFCKILPIEQSARLKIVKICVFTKPILWEYNMKRYGKRRSIKLMVQSTEI